MSHLNSEELSPLQTESLPSSPSIPDWMKHFLEEPNCEKKLRLALEAMKSALAQEGAPNFRKFWEMRRCCLPLFKETLSSTFRTQCWKEFREISGECSRLQEHFDEQIAFTVEQVDLAADSIEKDLSQYEEKIKELPEFFFSEFCQAIVGKNPLYFSLQKEIHFLNTLATRVHTLRKEIIPLAIRLRHKSRIFQRLSDIGNVVFPKRKEQILQLSALFTADIESFIQRSFHGPLQGKIPYFALREEIQNFQNLAKILFLPVKTLISTRQKLSEYWDKIRIWEKERKKAISEKKLEQKKNHVTCAEQIQQLVTALQQGIPLPQFQARKRELLLQLKTLSFERSDREQLYQTLIQLHSPQEKKPSDTKASKEEKVPALKGTLEKEKLQEKLTLLLKEAPLKESSALEQEKETLFAEMKSLSLNERQPLEQELEQLNQLLFDRKDKALSDLIQNPQVSEAQLQSILQQKKELRQQLKAQLEQWRKLVNKSGLNFDQALYLRELMDQGKKRLEQLSYSVESLEDRISVL